jgi:uncharacterized protein YrrD
MSLSRARAAKNGEMRRAEELLTLPVLVRGVKLGRAVDLIVAPDGSRALGIEVRCGDGVHRFLPLAVTTIGEGAIEIDSPLVLLDFDQVGFYREQASSLRELDGGRAKLVVHEDGALERLARGRR